MENKEKNFISAVVYIHNAEDQVPGFLSAIIKALEDNFEHSEMICVNDASNDGSYEAIKAVSEAADSTSISIINMSYYHGLELSMNAGVDLSIGDFVFEFDSTTLDFNPELISKVYHRSLEGFDIVSASPDKHEKLSSRLFYQVFNRFAPFPYEMATERFRILSRRVINRIGSMNRVILYRKALYMNCGLKTDTLRYLPQESKASKHRDRQEHSYRSRLAVDSLILFTQLGYRFSMVMTMLMMAMSLFVVAYTLVTYLTLHPVAGWTTTILFLSISFFGLFGVLTVIIKYLQLLVDTVFKRKHYSFESIEKIT